MKTRTFYIPDVDCETIVEETTRKEILGYIDELIESINYGIDTSDYAAAILYNDGSFDYITEGMYDGHKIRRQNIASIVYANPGTDTIYGNFEMNECGVVTVAFETKIHESIIER